MSICVISTSHIQCRVTADYINPIRLISRCGALYHTFAPSFTSLWTLSPFLVLYRIYLHNIARWVTFLCQQTLFRGIESYYTVSLTIWWREIFITFSCLAVFLLDIMQLVAPLFVPMEYYFTLHFHEIRGTAEQHSLACAVAHYIFIPYRLTWCSNLLKPFPYFSSVVVPSAESMTVCTEKERHQRPFDLYSIAFAVTFDASVPAFAILFIWSVALYGTVVHYM